MRPRGQPGGDSGDGDGGNFHDADGGGHCHGSLQVMVMMMDET